MSTAISASRGVLLDLDGDDNINCEGLRVVAGIGARVSQIFGILFVSQNSSASSGGDQG
ncbi:hypothetical protein [Oryza sativa Japonica Group]|uniref:Uncharacterized protein n=2 Tax=Oryza sativa subsp. japonica TaxID=39947 RepID=Q656Q1_ORYSJ|nr:hypothetical protein OsJ_02310 [Oryza sativa Japonica Group]BAD45195.1 hypothetical protein [Oryza sativa Japonica Group]BAD45216.1 hypothetical protein [Oryza sativa Japonica Group]